MEMTSSISEHSLIRTARPEDYESIASIYNESVEDSLATMDEALKTASDVEELIKNFNSRERLFVLEHKKEIIGWAVIRRYSDRNGYRFTAETSIYITKNETSKGFGSKMNDHLNITCQHLGYKHLVAKITAVNHASISAFSKAGYTIVGKQEKIGYKDSQWLDVIIMQKLFD